MQESPKRFIITEALPPKIATALPPSLRVGTTPIYYRSLLLRLLTGTIDFECSKTNAVIKSRADYSTLGIPQYRAAFKKTIISAIPVDLARYERITKSLFGYNNSLWEDIFNEFCGYLMCQTHEQGTKGFLHLYRTLERIAYCIPLLWAARAPDYRKTFGLLKKYFEDPKRGELRAFEKFVADFVDETERKTHATFNLASAHLDWKQRYFKTLNDLVKNNPKYYVGATASDQVIVHFEGVLELMIKCRNQYFHALTGNSHFFRTVEIPDGDEFFSCLNENIANWLAFIIFKVFAYELERHR